jgi:hypothetical protein
MKGMDMKRNEDDRGKLEYSVLVKESYGGFDDKYAEVLERNEGDLRWKSLCGCDLDTAEEIATALQWRADVIWEQQEQERFEARRRAMGKTGAEA